MIQVQGWAFFIIFHYHSFIFSQHPPLHKHFYEIVYIVNQSLLLMINMVAFSEKIINFLCKWFKLDEYSDIETMCAYWEKEALDLQKEKAKTLKKLSMYQEYSPIDYMKSLPDKEGCVYVWVLKKDVNPTSYLKMITKHLNEKEIVFKAEHFFVKDVEDIKKIPSHRMKPLLKFYHSNEAKEGGR